MTGDRLHRRAFELSCGAHVVALAGELDIDTVPLLRDELDSLTGTRLVLDLRDVTYVDVAGLGLLVRVSRRRDVSVVTSNPHTLQLLASTGAGRSLDVHAQLEPAVAGLL